MYYSLVYSFILCLGLITLCLYLLGQIQSIKNFEARVSQLEKVIQVEPNSSNHFYILGQLYLRKKYYDKAITLFRTALSFWNPNDKIGLGSLYNTLGFTYFNLKQYEHSIYYYLQAIKILPDYTLALTNLGFAYENKKLYKEAYNTYKIALNYDATNKIAFSRLEYVKSKSILN